MFEAILDFPKEFIKNSFKGISEEISGKIYNGILGKIAESITIFEEIYGCFAKGLVKKKSWNFF